MQKRGRIFPVFSLFFALSLLIFVFFQKGLLQGISGMSEFLAIPLKRVMYQSVIGLGKDDNSAIAKLRSENAKLVSELVKEKETERENEAFHDQFATTALAPTQLLPATVVGMNGFLPGVSKPDTIIIDKGSTDGIRTGSVVVYKDEVVGKVTSISVHLATVMLPTNKNFSVTAQTAQTSALGILQGQEDGMILANVVLSDTLNQDDFVVTKNSIDKNGNGFPPNLVLGKIISVSKRASDLFQEGKVESLVDFSKLDTVFIIVGS